MSDKKTQKKRPRTRFPRIGFAIFIVVVYLLSFSIISYLSNQNRWEGYLKHTPRPIKYVVGAKKEWEKKVRRNLGFRYCDREAFDRWAYYFYFPAYKATRWLLPGLPPYKRSAIFGGGPPQAE